MVPESVWSLEAATLRTRDEASRNTLPRSGSVALLVPAGTTECSQDHAHSADALDEQYRQARFTLRR